MSRNGADEKAASKLPRNSCQVPKKTRAMTKTTRKIETSLFTGGMILSPGSLRQQGRDVDVE
ncbi:hypothetical protein Gmet_3583 [Geobacter metallireducens GS-15]|uniref:Uncharacterized protein n=1 Tax=Geobacter metallireducens (strain ATCC 53774 / DSM 7210 / GS-15) TaxID=269799 RepID=J7M077_GEOMG|nr:hypothetical protein Gmet_3583 [Geobacter metallireducens GS-15]